MKDTKELRAFLLLQMKKVADGEIEADKVKNICAVAQQVYNTMKVEIKVAEMGAGSIRPVSLQG